MLICLVIKDYINFAIKRAKYIKNNNSYNFCSLYSLNLE